MNDDVELWMLRGLDQKTARLLVAAERVSSEYDPWESHSISDRAMEALSEAISDFLDELDEQKT